MHGRTNDQEQWLAAAADALAEAERLAGLLSGSWPRRDIALASLQAEIAVLRREILNLQRDRAGERHRRELHPDWIEFSAWTPAS